MTDVVAIDTSVAVPLLVQTHAEHAMVTRWAADRPLALSGHALAETYSVVTRLPGDVRLEPRDAARLMAARFLPPVTLPDEVAQQVPELLADRGIAGGATYDALVALAAVTAKVPLATRDARALPTYRSLGANVVVSGGGG